MTNPVTPNIGLNKIDRTSPSTTYFDLEKYIDQNADAVDQFAGEASDSINALEKRLDTEERREVVLQPGLQIVNAERSAPFKLSGIKGRTLVNLLGQDGDCEGAVLTSYNASAALDTNNFTRGSKGLKVTVSSGQTSGSGGLAKLTKLFAGRYYLGLANVKNGTASHGRVVVGGQIGTVVSDSSKFSVSYVKFNPDSDYELSVGLWVDGREGQYAYADELRLFEISAAEYAALEGITPEQVAAKYPYVDSVQPVRNPYAIRCGENLLPPFYEAFFAGSLAGFPYIVSPYEGRVNASGVNVGFQYWIPCVPNKEYTFAVENDGVIALQDMDKDKVLINNNGGFLDAQRASIITANNAVYLHILMSSGPKGAGTYTFKNPMLTIGTESKRFKPQEDSMLALQTDLYADPVSGANADEVFEKDGQYFRLAKWGKATLTDKFNYVGIGGRGVGWKQTFFDLPSNTSGPYSETVVKYDGIKLQSNQITSSPDISAIDSGNAKRCYISIANTDSGWGDNYTPTTDEIKAYFMGWTMYDGSGSNATPDNPINNYYNGTGVKAWAYRADGVTRSWLGWTDKLPTTQAPNWTPYQLLYRLAKESIEPIVSEGMLTLNEGDNQIEVGTGIVIRERAVFAAETPTSGYSYNAVVPGAGQAKYKVKDFLSVYESGRPISGYTKVLRTTHNGAAINVPRDLFNTSAAYSVTYLMLDTSPIVPFTGSYSANEKAMLQELTDAVQQNATAVSALTNRKVDKSASDWIIPTLMNSWVSTADAAPLRYMKDSNGAVRIVGRVSKGAISSGILLFVLPEGYKPSVLHIFASLGTGDTGMFPCEITVNPDGFVQMWSLGGNKYVDVCLPSFLAEK
ncbi:hypothetical protein J28TS4_37420 [Paenibacillus lautus]|uniref:hypothetical protein n=1 Tax=Paenibacillus lautus TaxID=1401 RepID=UPI001B2732CC|nr:hypothetical protein [Paenibacillus lautus]GIP05335.1 hypothetical protein J28TS4_37420 [Paenibacillus lautus]